MRNLWLVVAVCPVAAQVWQSGAEVDVNSRYLWRGQTYTEGPVMQPYLWASRGDATFSVWSSMTVGSDPGRGRFDQVFFSASRTFRRERWSVEAGLQGYHWQANGAGLNATTVETAARAARDLGPFEFFSSHTIDFGQYRGSYIGDAGLGWRRTFRGNEFAATVLAAWANARFNTAYAGVAALALNYSEAELSITLPMRGRWFVRPHTQFAAGLSRKLKEAGNSSTAWVGSVAVGLRFR